MTPCMSNLSDSSTGLFNQPININEDASIDYWLKALDCSELELRVAVAAVGSMAGDVGSQLAKVL